MARQQKRSGPSYLCIRRGAIHYRYRMVVEHRGLRVERWVYTRSEYPDDWEASLDAVRFHRAQLRRKLIAEIDEGLAEQRPATAPTLRDITDAWLADARSRGVQVDVAERYRAEILLDALGPDLLARDLTTSHLDAAWKHLRADRNLGTTSANAYLALAKMILRRAVHHQQLAASPADPLRPIPNPRRPPATLSAGQVQAIFEALGEFEKTRGDEPPMRGLVLCGYYTLARSGNVRRIRWEHVDLGGRMLVYPETKNTRRVGVRVVAPLLDPIYRYLLERHPGGAASGWVFPNPATGEPYGAVRKSWAELVHLANKLLPTAERIPTGFRMYNLRHSGASHLAATGKMSALEIAELMGDTDVATVERWYFSLDSERIRASLSRAAKDRDLRELARAASRGLKDGSKAGSTGGSKPGSKR